MKGKVEEVLKVLKRLGSMLMVLALLVAIPLSASASSGINAHEQRILDALSEPIQLEGRTTSLPAQYINQARTYVMRADVDLTSSEANQIIGYINQARDLVINGGFSSFSEMPQSFLNQLIELAQRAAAVIGLTLSFDLSSGLPVITIVSDSGEVVVDGDNVIKQTGLGVTASAVVLLGLTGAVGACGVVAKKRNLFVADVR